MGIKDRIQLAERNVDALRSLGRDPSALEFDEIITPTQAVLGGERVTLFGTNNYLGLTFHAGCVDAAKTASQLQGSGTTGSRMANGSYASHRKLEHEIAAFHGKRDTIIFSTGYLANVGMISALAVSGDYLLIDADSHASIYDGCKMSDAETLRFKHNSPESLARRLKHLAGSEGDKVVIVEGIYSMLGDTAPLKEIAAVVREAGEGVYLMIDEAHSLGVIGHNGRGLSEEDDVEKDCDFITGTFSKSIGTTGGYCVSDHEWFSGLRILSRPYIFTASMTPSAVETARAAFGIVGSAEGRALKSRLQSNYKRVFAGVRALGFETGPQAGPVVALQLPDPQTAIAFWNRTIDEGIYTNIAIPPATPNGLSLLRVSVSAAHTDQEIDRALAVFESIGTESGLISSTRPRTEKLRSPAA